VEVVAVRDDGDVVEGGEGADLFEFGDAAAPFGVGLDDANGVGLEETMDFPAAVEVFAGGDGDAGGRAEPGVGIDFFTGEGFFEPAGFEGFDFFAPLEGVGEIPAVEDVEHDVG